MNRDWSDFKSLYGNAAGARETFECYCESLFREIYTGQNVKQVKVHQGDGGIDIFVGELGVKPITVIQCKFFIDSFGESQKSQIRESFKTAVGSEEYELKNWILCIPNVLDINNSKWWSTWKDKQLTTLNKSDDFIQLKNGNELISLMKKHGVYNQAFKIDEALLLKGIDEKIDLLLPKEKVSKTSNKASEKKHVLFNNYTEESEPFYQKRNIDLCFKENIRQSNNIWVFGKSGAGKTALISRNLIQDKVDYIYCDLSPISINSIEDVFNEVVDVISECKEKQYNYERYDIKSICKFLCDCNFTGKIVIVIDELSINDQDLLESFADNVIRLVDYFNKHSADIDLSFVLSTIHDPTNIVKNKGKAIGLFHYLPSDNWEQYIDSLFDIINESLCLNICNDGKKIILSFTKGIPRFMSVVFRKLLVENDFSIITIKSITKQTAEEYF
ncbi:TPA: hypothetical protein ACX6RR_001991 [Photobacterium damselae]